MEQPRLPNTSPPSPPSPPSSAPPQQREKMKLPTPKDLISHYESQGLDTQEASLKVIEDLQKVLFRVVSSGRGKKEKTMNETSKKLDKLGTRITILEMKVDSKPGYGQSLAIGVAAGGLLNGITTVLPRVVGGIGNMWNAVKSVNKDSPSV